TPLMALIMAVRNSPPNCKPASRSFALLWMRRARESNRRGAVTGLRIILPKNGCAAVAHRLAALDPKLAVELYEHDAALNILEKIDPQRAGNLDAWLVPQRESEALLTQARSALDAIVAGAPQAVTLHPAAQSREVWLRYRGLAFARWDNGRVFFGINDASEELTPASRPTLRRILHNLEVHRHPLARDTRHSLVAPSLRFHPATYDLLNCFSTEMEIVRVVLAEGCRRGIRVVMRQ